MTFDILLPFWGNPEHLRLTVASVRAQTDADWRLVVVDDCYPDEDVPTMFAAISDPRITYVRNEVNLGITANYQRCLDLATSPYVVMMGCDDLMLPGYLAAVRRAITQWPDVDVVQPGVGVIDEHGRDVLPLADRVKRWFAPRSTVPVVLEGEDLAVSLLRADWLYWPSLVLRREALVAAGFRDGFPIVQDLAIVMDIVLDGGRLLWLPEDVFRYRRHGASASSASVLNGARFDGERRYFALAQQQAAERGWSRAARAARTHLTSRLHAASLVPRALKAGGGALGVVVGHAVNMKQR